MLEENRNVKAPSAVPVFYFFYSTNLRTLQTDLMNFRHSDQSDVFWTLVCKSEQNLLQSKFNRDRNPFQHGNNI